MNRIQQILGGLLVVQLIAAVIVFWPKQAAEQGELMFPDVQTDQIVAFSIDDDTGNSVGFERVEDGWVLSGTDGFPTTSDKVDPVLEKLVEIKTGRLVASNPESFDRLQVADDGFMRRVWFKDANGNEYLLFIGSSVGAGATHIRKAGSEEVFLTDKVSVWEFGSEARTWIDVVYLEIPREQMLSMRLVNDSGELAFINEGTAEEENWVMLGLAADEVFNSNNLVSMLTRLTNLQITEPVGKEVLPEYGFDNPSAVVTLDYLSEDDGMQTLILQVGALDETDNQFYVKASTSEYIVKIPKYSMQDFVERTRDVFLVSEEATTEAPSE